MLKEIEAIDIKQLVSKEELLKEMFIALDRWNKLDSEMTEYGNKLTSLGIDIINLPDADELKKRGIITWQITEYLQHIRAKGVKPKFFPTSEQLKAANIDIDRLLPNHQIETPKFVYMVSHLVRKLLYKHSINHNPTNIDNEDKFQSCALHILKAWRKFDFKTRQDPFGFFTTCCVHAIAACFEELYQRKKNVPPQLYVVPVTPTGIYNTLRAQNPELDPAVIMQMCYDTAMDEANTFINGVYRILGHAKAKMGHNVQDVLLQTTTKQKDVLRTEYSKKVDVLKEEAAAHIKEAVDNIRTVIDDIDSCMPDGAINGVDEYIALKCLSYTSSHTEVATTILAFVRKCKELNLSIPVKLQRDLIGIRQVNMDSYKAVHKKRGVIRRENETLLRQIPSWMIDNIHYRIKVGTFKSKWVQLKEADGTSLFILEDGKWVVNETALINIYFKLGKFDRFELKFGLRSISSNSVSISYCGGDGESNTLHNL